MYPLIGQTYDELNLDTLNQVDENGSKTGYWVELLSKDFKVVKKEKKASFYRFVYFQNDVRFDAKIPTYNVPFKEFVVKLDGTSQKGEIKILNGKFSFFTPRTNILSLEFLFKNGHLISLKEYHKNGNIVFEVDYNRNNMYSKLGGLCILMVKCYIVTPPKPKFRLIRNDKIINQNIRFGFAQQDSFELSVAQLCHTRTVIAN
jgi:hypothetical protein